MNSYKDDNHCERRDVIGMRFGVGSAKFANFNFLYLHLARVYDYAELHNV